MILYNEIDDYKAIAMEMAILLGNGDSFAVAMIYDHIFENEGISLDAFETSKVKARNYAENL